MGFIENEWIIFLKQLKWQFIIGLSLLYVGAFRGFFILLSEAKWQTVIVCYFLSIFAGIGVLAGAHRFFSHRSFKANRKLTFILCVLQTLSGQKSIIDWSLDHLTHHKYEGTNADAVSLGRGFFFAHMGWLFIERHPECEEKRNKLDADFLWSDPFVKFQHDFYWPLFFLIGCLVPTLIPYVLFDESLVNSFYTCFAFRWGYTMQLALSGNSIAHIHGYREYEKSSTGTHNKVLNYLTLGGAYHNFHHAFPQDYSASEFGIKSFNIYTAFIEFFAWIGWAYDLKKVPQKYVQIRKERTGGEEDLNAIFKKHPFVDWFLGLIVSFNIILTVLAYRSVISLIYN